MTTYTREDEEANLNDSSMSFLDHLDELRSRLIRCAIFVMVAFGASWAFSDKIYHFLEVPVLEALAAAHQRSSVPVGGAEVVTLQDLPDRLDVIFTFPTDCRVGETLVQAGSTVPFKVQTGPDGSKQLVTSQPWVINGQSVIQPGFVLPTELLSSKMVQLNPNNRLVVPTVQGAFNLYIKVAFYAAIFFAMPFLLVQIWGFVAPGLYPHEKKYAAPFIIMASVSFLIGCAFAYYIAFPRAANFLLGVAAEGNLRPLVTADDYFDLILTIMLGLGIVFEIPTVTFVLARLGLITHRILLKMWRYAVIVIFVVAAILSPTTDVPNLLVFAAPMLILYMFSVGIAWVFYRKRRKREAARD